MLRLSGFSGVAVQKELPSARVVSADCAASMVASVSVPMAWTDFSERTDIGYCFACVTTVYF